MFCVEHARHCLAVWTKVHQRLMALIGIPGLIVYEIAVIIYIFEERKSIYKTWAWNTEKNGEGYANWNLEDDWIELFCVDAPILLAGMPVGVIVVFVLIFITSLWIAEEFGYKIDFNKQIRKKDNGLND